MSGISNAMRKVIGRTRRGGSSTQTPGVAGAEGTAGPAAPMGALAMQDQPKKRMGRNRNTIMQDRLGG
jgi:hypothetical protein